jgi:Ala-tRNA(Pro) deacylase
MTCRETLETYFQRHDVPFEVQEHGLAFTAQKVAASEHVPGRMLAKVVMVFVGDGLTMLVMPAHFQVDLEATKAGFGRDVRLASEAEFAPSFPDCEPGAMPPFGNLYGVPVYADEALARNEQIVFQAGTHTETMSVSYEAFDRLVQPIVARLGFVPGKSLPGS